MKITLTAHNKRHYRILKSAIRLAITDTRSKLDQTNPPLDNWMRLDLTRDVEQLEKWLASVDQQMVIHYHPS